MMGRTHACSNRFRHLPVRTERRAALYQTLTD